MNIVRKAFESRLKAWADAQTPAIPVAWQNVPFTPPAGRYVRAFLLPAQTQSDTLEREHRRYEGIFQVSLILPLGTGSALSESLAASLDAYFGMYFIQDGVEVHLTLPMSAASPIPDPERFHVPVSARYRADVL